MPTATLTANAVGTYDSWTNFGGGDKPLSVSGHDFATTYIWHAGNGTTVRQTFSPAGIPAALVAVTTHSVVGVLRNILATSQHWGMYTTRIGGTDTNSAGEDLSASWAEYSAADVGGADITRAQLEAAEFGVVDTREAGNTWQCTYLHWDITYRVHAGGFVIMIGGLGPLAAVLLQEMPALASHVWRRTGQLILPGEYREAWDEIRAHRWPHTVDLGHIDRSAVLV